MHNEKRKATTYKPAMVYLMLELCISAMTGYIVGAITGINPLYIAMGMAIYPLYKMPGQLNRVRTTVNVEAFKRAQQQTSEFMST